MLNEVNSRIKDAKVGDIMYNLISYRSFKIQSISHIERLVEDNIHIYKVYGKIKYELFDPHKHLHLNKKRGNNHIPKLI